MRLKRRMKCKRKEGAENNGKHKRFGEVSIKRKDLGKMKKTKSGYYGNSSKERKAENLGLIREKIVHMDTEVGELKN